MNNELFSDINFEYVNDEQLEYVKSLNLKSICGEELFFYPLIGNMSILCDKSADIFFIRVSIRDRETDKKYQERLLQKYIRQCHYARRICEYILLIDNKIVRVFVDYASYADGVSISLLEIITSDFKDKDIPFIKNIISKAMWRENRGVPEYSYTDTYLKVTISGFKLFK